MTETTRTTQSPYAPPPPRLSPQPQPATKRRSWPRRHKILTALGLIALVIVIAAVAGGGGDDKESSTTGPATEAQETPAQDVYAIGDTAHTSGFDVTVHQVVSPWQSSNQFETPQAGHHFVAVEASLVNVEGDELVTWSSLMGAELTDSQGRPWDIALAGSELPSLDGDVGLGMTRRGWVVFEVADDATGLLLRLKGSLTATGSLFDLGT